MCYGCRRQEFVTKLSAGNRILNTRLTTRKLARQYRAWPTGHETYMAESRRTSKLHQRMAQCIFVPRFEGRGQLSGNGKFPDIFLTFCGIATRVPMVRESQGKQRGSGKSQGILKYHSLDQLFMHDFHNFCRLLGALPPDPHRGSAPNIAG